MDHPTRNRDIRTALQAIHRKVTYDLLYREIADAINVGRAYEGLRDRQDTYVVRAAKAEVRHDGGLNLTGGTSLRGKPQKVEVMVMRDGLPRQKIVADTGRIDADYSVLADASLVSIEMKDDVQVTHMAQSEFPAQNRGEWASGTLPLPAAIQAAGEKINPESLLDPDALRQATPSSFIRDSINNLKNEDVAKLRGKIRAEMHTRIAYNISCFLLVTMGAALGLIYRGGQIISAFALSVVPAAAVIVMIVMGKQLLGNPHINPLTGLAAIWAGVSALLAADIIIYARLSRV